jgi:cysteinyl-tRNA synthetase
MALRLYNTLTKKKEVFRPSQKGVVKLYTCGPTVYDYAHVGNFRTFVFQDLLRRWLLYRGYRVIQVMNITDVDEKTIERARRLRKNWRELAQKYEKAFMEDLALLNIQRAEYYPRISEHIDDVVELSKKLLKAGLAIRGKDGGIYLDITKVRYGRLSGLTPKERLRAKIRREDYKEPKHFVLWKPWEEKDGNMVWESHLGRGRPGWHAECGVLALRYLGDVDIHSGGVDLVFPHHENTLALWEAAKGRTLHSYWLHVEHLTAHGEKMSKSRGNYYTLKGLMKKGHDPLAVRLLLFSEHYREKMDFTPEKLMEAGKNLERLRKLRSRTVKKGEKSPSRLIELTDKARKDFKDAMDDDLSSGKALRVVLNFAEDVQEMKEKGKIIGDFLDETDRVLGILEGGRR